MSDDDLDVSAVAADAALLDALAAGAPGTGDDALAGLAALRSALDEDLRLDSTATPMQAAPVGDVVALRRPSGRRSSGRAAVVVAGAALVLSSTGVAAATYEARPGDAFYGLRTAVAGPRAEDPQLLRERLDAVQQQLGAADPATREAAREELAEVAALMNALDPELRAPLEQRHAVLTERLSTTAPPSGPAADTPPTGTPAGPPAGVPTGPPAGKPGPTRTPDNRPEPTQGPPTAPPAGRPSATPEPAQDRPSPQGERPSPAPSASPREERPSPRSTQAASPSRAPRGGPPDGVGAPGRPSAPSAEPLTVQD